MMLDSEERENQARDIRDFFDGRIEQFADRSARRLLENKENVRGLVEIVAEDLAALIDFDRLVAVNRTLLPEILREQEADIVFRVPFKSGAPTDELLIYILIEHQSTVDETMGFRVLFYMVLLWDAQRRQWETDKVPKRERRLSPILPIVFYTGDNRWQTPLTLESLMDIPEQLTRFVPRFDTLFLNVKETDAATLTKTDHPFGWLLTVLQKERADKAAISRALIEVLSYLSTLDTAQASQRREAIWYLVSLILHRQPVEEHQELISLIDRHTHDTEVEPMAQTMAEALHEQGIAEGIERGARQNAVQNILSVLAARFPQSNPQSVEQGLDAILDIERLTQLHLTAVQTPSFDAFLQALDT